MADAPEDPLVAKAFDAKRHAELAAAIEQLSPQEAEFFVDRLERALRKRKLQLTGYLVALGVWLLGMTGAVIYAAGQRDFVAWVYAIPFALVGAVLWGFGVWANRIARGPAAPPRAADRPPPP